MLPNLSSLRLDSEPTGPKAEPDPKPKSKPYSKNKPDPKDYMSGISGKTTELRKWLQQWVKRPKKDGDWAAGGADEKYPKMAWYQTVDDQGNLVDLGKQERDKLYMLAQQAIDAEKAAAKKTSPGDAFEAAESAFLKKAYDDAYREFMRSKFPVLIDGEYYPPLDWQGDVMPMLVKLFGNDWASGEASVKETKIKAAMAQARLEKKNGMLADGKLEEEALQHALAARQAAEVDAKKAGQEAQAEHELEELEADDVPPNFKQKFRGLLRFIFNRTNPELTGQAKYRRWHKVDAKMRKRRIAWAKKTVADPNFDPSNPPLPDPDLYTEFDVKVVNTWSAAVATYALYDTVEDVSVLGGMTMWRYMRFLESQYPVPNLWKGSSFEPLFDLTPTMWPNLPLQPQGQAYLQAEVRSKQLEEFKENFTEYMEGVAQLGALDAAYDYTVGSGKFNKYLLSLANNASLVPSYGAGPGGVGGSTLSGQIGPPELVHKLYKIVQAAPRPTSTMHFLRAVNSQSELPHVRAGISDPQEGQVIPNATFISASMAAPSSYLSGVLATFFNSSSVCCFQIITTPKGFPILPMVVGKSKYKNEQEVVLPAGTLLIYRGVLLEPGLFTPGESVKFVMYDAELPPTEVVQQFESWQKFK